MQPAQNQNTPASPNFISQLMEPFSPDEKALLAEKPLEGLKVLVCDVNTQHRERLREWLSVAGARVTESPNEQHGYSILKESLDAGIPYAFLLFSAESLAEGSAWAEELRKTPNLVKHVIVLQAQTDLTEEEVWKAKRGGIDAVLTQPLQHEEVFQAFQQILKLSKPSNGSTEAEATSLPSLRILVAEDLADNRFIMNQYLDGTPCQVEMAVNGEEALEKYMEDDWDLVLMDMQMPIMDGYGATQAIRAWEQECGLPPTPIIAITAYTTQNDILSCKEAGCTSYVGKPLARNALIEAISKVCS